MASSAETHHDQTLRAYQRSYPHIVWLGHSRPIWHIHPNYRFTRAQIEDGGARAQVMRETTDLLNAPSTCIGIKSSPGDPDVQMRPNPNSKYAFHLGEKGLESHCIYCSDFVHAKTREPINSFQAFPEHELWECPPTNDPLSFVTSSRKRTLETAYGIPQDEVLLGEKKFAASEGTSVTHVDLGMRHVLFDVPLGQPHGARRDWMIP